MLRLDPDQEFSLMVLSAALRYLNSMNGELDAGPNAADYHRTRLLLQETLREPPTREEVREVDDRLSAMLARLRKDRDLAVREQFPGMRNGR